MCFLKSFAEALGWVYDNFLVICLFGKNVLLGCLFHVLSLSQGTGAVNTTDNGMNSTPSPPLRSPRETLGGYVFLPRLIDKVRLHAQGKLPPAYIGNLLKPGLTLDGRFFTFTGLDAEDLRRAILAMKTDEEVLAWVERHAKPHTEAEKQRWIVEIEAYRPDAQAARRRREVYIEVAVIVDPATLNVFDLIDMDEGRIIR